MASNVWDEIIYPYPNLNGCSDEVWNGSVIEYPHFMKDAIAYPFRISS